MGTTRPVASPLTMMPSASEESQTGHPSFPAPRTLQGRAISRHRGSALSRSRRHGRDRGDVPIRPVGRHTANHARAGPAVGSRPGDVAAASADRRQDPRRRCRRGCQESAIPAAPPQRPLPRADTPRSGAAAPGARRRQGPQRRRRTRCQASARCAVAAPEPRRAPDKRGGVGAARVPGEIARVMSWKRDRRGDETRRKPGIRPASRGPPAPPHRVPRARARREPLRRGLSPPRSRPRRRRGLASSCPADTAL